MQALGLGRFQRAAASAWNRAGVRLRHADWGGIAFELAMIVTGILIAFQLDRLAERWRRSEDRKLYLERIADEATANVETLALNLAGMREDSLDLRRLLTAIDDPAQRARLGPGVGCGALRLPAVRLQSAAMEAYADADSLELLPDPELRRLIHRAAGIDSFTAGQLDYFRAFFIRYADDLHPLTRYRFDPASSSVECRMDFDRLAANPQAMSTLAATYVDRNNFQRFRQHQLRAHLDLRWRACALAGGGCRPLDMRPRVQPRSLTAP